MPEVTLHDLAKELARSWLEHLYTPAKGTVEAYVAAREALVLSAYPEFADLPKANAGDKSFKETGHSKRWHEALALIKRLGIQQQSKGDTA